MIQRFVGMNPDGTERWEAVETPLNFGVDEAAYPPLTDEQMAAMREKCQSLSAALAFRRRDGALKRIAPDEAPEGLREALEASWRLLLREHRIKIVPGIWEWEGHCLVRVEMDGDDELWTWTPGEPVFTREGGV